MLAVKISGYDTSMFIGNSPAQIRALNRLQACTFTIRQTIKDIEDPLNPDLRADLVIEAQELLNEVVLLSEMISKFAWSELDEKAHPSFNKEQNIKEND
jgi:hypothetical protein